MIDEANDIEFDYAVVYAAPTADLAGKTWNTQNGYRDVGAIALPKDSDGFAYKSGANRLNIYTQNDSSSSIAKLETDFGPGDWTSYSFYIELLEWSAATEAELRKGVSTTATYDELVANAHIKAHGIDIPGSYLPWIVPISTGATPEPTSGILLLIGGAALLLKRRKAVR